MRLTRLKCFFNKRVYVLINISKNRLSISTFNCGFICEHPLFVQYIKKKVCGFHKIFLHISKFYKKKKLLNTIFFILFIHEPSLGSRRSKTNRETKNTQTDKLKEFCNKVTFSNPYIFAT